jgi:hypothetical protein
MAGVASIATAINPVDMSLRRVIELLHFSTQAKIGLAVAADIRTDRSNKRTIRSHAFNGT